MANKKTDKPAAGLDTKVENFYLILDTSTARLGTGNLAFKLGDTYSVRYVEPLSEARTPLADFSGSC